MTPPILSHSLLLSNQKKYFDEIFGRTAQGMELPEMKKTQAIDLGFLFKKSPTRDLT